MVAAAAPAPRNDQSCREALAARTMRHRVWIGDFETAFLQIVAVIQHRSTDEYRPLRIYYHANAPGLDHDVAVGRTIYQIHFILEPRTTASDHRHSQSA